MKFVLILFSFFVNQEPMIFLHENGVRVMCSDQAIVGQKYTLKGVDYLVVDDQLLRELVGSGAPMESLITTRVTDMSYLFYRQANFNQNISHWDVSNVKNMTYMFGYNEIFNGNLSSWDTASVELFSDMFFGAESFNSDLSHWNVSQATHFNGMFHNSSFNSPLNTWDMSSATDLSGMFDDAIFFDQPLDQWDVSNVTNMGGMFAEAIEFNQDISMWEVTEVTQMRNMFRNASSFSYNLSDWTPNVAKMPQDFQFNASFVPPTFRMVMVRKYLILAAIPLLFLLFWIIRTVRSKTIAETDPFEARIMEKLKAAAITDNILTRNQLDDIFEISDQSLGIQKVNRAKYIRMINSKHQSLISRIKDDNDKRSFMYVVRMVK